MRNFGNLEWIDLTVDEGENIREFYQGVIGWTSEGCDMGGYNDYNMKSSNGDTISGICHARDANANIPPMWVPYFSVENIEESLTSATENGGTIIVELCSTSEGKYAIIKDPAGACCALWEKTEPK